MTDELQISVSEITEIPEGFGLGHFLAALCWGTLAGTGSMVLALMIASGFDFTLYSIGAALGILWLVGLVVAVFTLAGLLIVGLPLTLVLRLIEEESAALYAAIGAIAGFAIMAIIFEAHEDALAFAFSLVGAIAGGACAYRWGRWREAVVAHRLSKTPTRRTNPIHELTH